MGGPVADRSCSWEVRPGNVLSDHLQLIVTTADGGGPRGSSVSPNESDDVVWLLRQTPCVVVPTYKWGGVRSDVESVVLSNGGHEVVLDVIDDPAGEAGVVIGPIPNPWRSAASVDVRAIAADGTIVASCSLPASDCAITSTG